MDTASPPALPTDTTRYLVTRLWRDWVRRYTGRIFVTAVLMIVVAATSAAYPKLIEMAIAMLERKDARVLTLMPLAIIAITFIKGVASYGQSVLNQSIALRVIASLQKAMFAHLMRADMAAHHATSTGMLMSRFTNDVNLMRDALARSMTAMIRDLVTAVALIGMMFYLDWLLALVVVATFPIAGRPIIRIGRRMRRASTNVQAGLGGLTSMLNQAFGGIRLIKAYRMEGYERRRTNDAIDEVYRLTMKTVKGRARTYPVLETLSGLSVALVLAYGGYRISTGASTLGAFAGFLTAVIMTYQPVRSLGNLNASLQEGLAAVKRSFDLLDTPPGIVDRPDAKPLRVERGHLRVEEVTFAYEPGHPALDHVSLEALPGQTVALVGPSGSGKSTIMNLILRFYEADSGRITIDGEDICAVKMADLRANIALVSQDVILFDDTVAANIGFGRPGAGRNEIETAARNAAAHDFIAALPDGYDTLVGDKGSKLSGGERQRISIARAMLKDAPILLLDEATSALDAESEQTVQEALSRLAEGRTTLVIAHRLATVMGADVIYVLDDGKLVETGNHAALTAQGGLYARLAAMQFRSDGTDKGDAGNNETPQGEEGE